MLLKNRQLFAGVLVLFAAVGSLCAQELSAQEAQQAYERGVGHYMRGNYNMAAASFRRAAENAAVELPAAKSLAKVQIMRGRYEEAVETLNEVEPQDGEADWHVAMAEALIELGRYEEALTHAEAANELEPMWAPTVLARGELLEIFGRGDEAEDVYEAMDDIVADGGYRNDARVLVALGEILARYASLKGLKASEQANNIFNNYLQVAYQDVDEKYWPAHVVAGRFALEKHRFQTAESEFSAALRINSNLPDAHVGLAIVELHGWQFEECLKRVRLALAINPNHAEAMMVKAVCLLQWRKVDQAAEALAEALETNPNNPEALSLAAAACIRLGEDEKAEQCAEKVRQINPNCELLPLAIGEWLSAVRQFDRAEQYYLRAVELAAHDAEPLTGLGQLYMQTGQEELAEQMFAKAHEIDDFRADVVNYLNLLEEMADYDVLETEHFIVKVNGEYDRVLLDQVAAEAERIYAEVTADFGHAPPFKTIIEVFPTHERFSIRLTGRGWLGTVGACTGKVIVLVAPDADRGMFGQYNWATVLRHEFTHTVTLSATGNRIPHWFTEACAVWQQPDRRNFEATAALVMATREGRLFPIRQLDWGFIRPKRGGDRGLAYAQAEWIMEYIIDTQGYARIIEMLEGFRDGASQAEVFDKVLGMNEEDFDTQFRNWAFEQVKQWGFDATPVRDIRILAAAAGQRPDDAKVQADYAKALLREGDLAQAASVAERALELEPDNVEALETLALANLFAGDVEQAVDYALELEMADGGSPTAARVLADGYIELQEWSLALIWLERLKQRRPMDPHSYEQLTLLYAQLGRPEEALPNLIELHRRTMTEQEYARQIADIYRASDKPEQALHYYEQITHINPYEASAYEAIAAIHRNARRYGQAVSAAYRLALLQPESADAWAKLAMVRFVAARAAEDIDEMRRAKQEAEKSLEIDPDGPAKTVLVRIEEALEQMPAHAPDQDNEEPPSP